MAKIPVRVGDREVIVQEYGDGDEHIVHIDDRYYRVHHTKDKHYFMTNIRGAQRSVSGSPDQIRRAIVEIHLAHKIYGKNVQRRKEELQRLRDKTLNEIVERVVNASVVPGKA